MGILEKAVSPVGILLNKNFETADKVFIPIFDLGDFYLLEYAKRLINNNDAQIVILDISGQIRKNVEIREAVRNIEQMAPNHISLRNEKVIEKDFLESQDLMIISNRSWRNLVNNKSLWLSDVPSTLILSNPE